LQGETYVKYRFASGVPFSDFKPNEQGPGNVPRTPETLTGQTVARLNRPSEASVAKPRKNETQRDSWPFITLCALGRGIGTLLASRGP